MIVVKELSRMLLHASKALSLSLAFCVGLADPAFAGGSPSPGLIVRAPATKSPSKAAVLLKAISSGCGYYRQAVNLGYPQYKAGANSDRAHQIAAYLWGQEVRDPDIAKSVRTSVENLQFFQYTTVAIVNRVTGKGELTEYYPWTQLGSGGFADSSMDINISVRGAEDAKAGKFDDSTFMIASGASKISQSSSMCDKK